MIIPLDSHVRLWLGTLLIAIFASASGCGEDKYSNAGTAKDRQEGVQATAVPPGTPAQDASVPQATAALASQAASSGTAPTSRDDKKSAPMKDLTKAEERQSMPKAGQVNNHSSPSLDTKQQ